MLAPTLSRGGARRSCTSANQGPRCGNEPSSICAIKGTPISPRCSWTARPSARTRRRPEQRGRFVHALGRSRGGFGTKAVVACDANGLALAFELLCGQASELRAAPALLADVRAIGPIGRVVCDRAYSSGPWRRMIEEAGVKPCVPANRTHPPASYDRAAYKRRHRVENLWARLKDVRAVAFRLEKTAASYHGNLLVAAALDHLSNRP